MPETGAGLKQEEKETQKQQTIMLVVVLVLLAAGAAIVLLNVGDIRRAVSNARWDFAVYAFMTTVLVLLAQSGSYVLVNRAMGISLKNPDLMIIGIVSITIGNVVSVLGTAEHIIRALLIVPRGYRAGHVISASAVHAYIKDLVILVLVPVGLAIMLPTTPLSDIKFFGLIGLGIASAALLVFITLALFFMPLRQWLLGVFAGLWHFLGHIIPPLKRHEPGPEIDRFDTAVEEAKKAFRARPALAAPIAFLILADWVFTLITLEFAFLAFNYPVQPGTLMVGYALGKVSGILSFIPGGLGIYTVSTVGAYVLLGVPFFEASVAVVLFRVIYHYAPYPVSFVFYRYLLKRTFPD
jgi:uncharacterized protein (TIRG00374 family)